MTSTDGSRPVVLSHGLWQTSLRRRRRTSSARASSWAGVVTPVVGVAPANFTGVELEAVDLWLALTHSPELCSFTGENLLSSSNSAWLSTIGRIRDPFTIEQAAAEVAATDKRPFAELDAPGTALRPLASSRRARLVAGRPHGALAGRRRASRVADRLRQRRRARGAARLRAPAGDRDPDTARRDRQTSLPAASSSRTSRWRCSASAAPSSSRCGWTPRFAAFFPTLPDARMNGQVAEDHRRVRAVCRARRRHHPGRADRPIQRVAAAARRPSGDRRRVADTQRAARPAARTRAAAARRQRTLRAIRAQPADRCRLRHRADHRRDRRTGAAGILHSRHVVEESTRSSSGRDRFRPW